MKRNNIFIRKIVMIIAFSVLNLNLFGQWYLISNQDEFINYDDVSITNDSVIFVSGSIWDSGNVSGLILKSSNMGNSWDTAFFNTSCSKIIFPSDSIGYFLGYPDKVYKTIDKGSTWQIIADSLNFANTGYNLFFLNNDTGFFSFQNNGAGFYRTLNGGSNWTQIIDSTLQSGNELIGGLDVCFNNGYLYLTGGNYFLKSSDYGIHWNIFSNDSIYNTNKTICVINDTIWMGGSVGVGSISKSSNGGLTWNTNDFQQLHYVHDIEMISSSEGYVVSQYNDSVYAFLKTIDGGNTWYPQQRIGNTIYGSYMKSIKCINDSTCFAVGQKGSIFKTLNGGGTLLNILPYKPINNNIIIYPNPSNEKINIVGKKIVSIEVFTITGSKIKSINNIMKDSSIDLMFEYNGIYIIKILTNNNLIIKKVIIKK